MTQDEKIQALEDWMTNRPVGLKFSYSEAATKARMLGVEGDCDRVADRVQQKLRRRGVIVPRRAGRSRWWERVSA